MTTTLQPDRDSARAETATELRLALFTDTYPPQLNGVSRTLERLVTAIHARGGEARVYTTTDPEATTRSPDIWRRPSIPFWAYPQLRLAPPVGGKIFSDLLAWRPTLIHAATPFGMGLTGRACALRLGVPLVTSYHTSFSEYARFYNLGMLSGLGWAFFRWFHNTGQRTYVPTRAIADELGRLGFARLAIWGRGIETQQFNPRFRSAAWRQRLGAGDDTIVVAYVGRLAAEKGLDVALRSMKILSSNPRIRFALAGDGPYADHCRREAPGNAIFTGRIVGESLSAFYASADLFIFPSTTDTFGNVLLEAMASGLPVIAADVGPTRELLAKGGGVMFPAGDGRAMADQIQALADDPARRQRLTHEGLDAAQHCSWDRIFDALVADYRQVLTEPPTWPRRAITRTTTRPLSRR
ncbi:MAG TPA: glycosyltransferase family 1 protein [Gemmatimonadaceae bacterium]|nr:glycosyltransferase family 1 protein [Gemmatimonadaceae bacterium]